MQRRKFIKISSLATLPVLLKSCQWMAGSQHDFDITVFTDMDTGHLLLESRNYPRGEKRRVKTLIVGGGIAGLSAACRLKGSDFLLCELSKTLGGTSAFHSHGGLTFAQGAHYDLAYPAGYGEEVLEMLESLEIIEYQPWKDSWSFKDRQYIITHRRKSRCFENGQFRGEVLPKGPLRDSFQDLMARYSGAMKMPLRLVDKAYYELNGLTFLRFLKDRLDLDPGFVRGLDYHMLDDWGGTADQVSALAGIHYFACRPYDKEVVDLFSPPEGNGYFMQRLAHGHSSEQLLTGHLVRSIRPAGSGFAAEVIEVRHGTVKTIEAESVVYAGQKNALKYILPDQYALFNKNVYAPWLVLNFIIDNRIEGHGYWQNEMVMEDRTFLGFIDSNMQYEQRQQKRVLTAYYCLPPGSRGDLKNVEARKAAIVEKTAGYLNQYFREDIRPLIEHVYIKVMGHAMPVPGPRYLLNDKNKGRKYPNLTFAGVDNGRLPLLFEALDSGIRAVAAITGDL